MAPLDTLTDDQRAVLQMLLRRDNSYEDLAALLKTDIGVVRKRARAAIAAIGPDASEIGSERRDELADYLLGQQTVARHEATREYLRGSSAGRAWAKDVAKTLSPLAGGTLPDIPGGDAEAPTAEAPTGAAATGAAPAAGPAATPDAPTRNPQLGSRLIAAGIGLVLAIAIIVVISIGGKDDAPTASDTPTQTSTTTQTTPGGDQYNVVAAASLLPPKGVQSTAKGDVAIFQFPATGQYRLGLQARGLPPSSTRGSAYGVWLYTSASKKRFLGFSQSNVGKDGKLATVSDLSPDTPNYGAVLLTRETVDAPKTPGRIILVGRMVTAADQQQSGGTSTTPSATAPSTSTPTTTTP